MKALIYALLFLALIAPVQAAERSKNWQVYFSPKGGCTEAVVDALSRAKSTVIVQPFNVEVYRSVFDTGWKEQQAPIDWQGEEEGQRNTAWNMLERYFIETPIKSNELPEAVEVPVEADLSHHGLPIRMAGRDTSWTTSCPSSAGAPTPQPTCNGRPLPKAKPKTKSNKS